MKKLYGCMLLLLGQTVMTMKIAPYPIVSARIKKIINKTNQPLILSFMELNKQYIIGPQKTFEQEIEIPLTSIPEEKGVHNASTIKLGNIATKRIIFNDIQFRHVATPDSNASTHKVIFALNKNIQVEKRIWNPGGKNREIYEITLTLDNGNKFKKSTIHIDSFMYPLTP